MKKNTTKQRKWQYQLSGFNISVWLSPWKKGTYWNALGDYNNIFEFGEKKNME